MEDISVTEVQAEPIQSAKQVDMLWHLTRLLDSGGNNVPAWTGFNSFLSSNVPPLTSVSYMPFIRAPPSDLSTIYTVLLQLVAVAEKLGQKHILVTADMAIYSKAQQIIWAKPELLSGKVTMRIGGMHLIMSFLASLGKFYGDGGLLSMLVDSHVYAEATARQMLQGKQYARGIRGIKIVLEALSRLYLSALLDWQMASNSFNSRLKRS